VAIPSRQLLDERNVRDWTEGDRVTAASTFEQICIAKFRYCRALDERDWKSFHSMLSPELQIDLTQLGGKVGIVSSTSYVDEARLSIGGFNVTQHVVTNLEFSSADNEVELRSYVHATHVLIDQEGSQEVLTLGGSYVDRLVLIEGHWIFSAIKLEASWTNGDPQLFKRARERALEANSH
jgi:hypothetical protein